MKTSILRENISKSSILFFSITAFILSAFLLTSCSESETSSELLLDDAALINEIESAAKITVAASSLPSATNAAFEGDYADSYVQNVAFASGLGYQVSIGTDNESRAEATSEIFFSEAGRVLKDKREKIKKRRSKNFQFVFPVDFIMPDDSSITLNGKEDWSLIREWYTANEGVKERPELVFPVDVTLEDGTVQTLIDRDDLKAIKNSSRAGKDKRKCFKLVLPVSFTMADGTEITVNERKEFRLIRRWHKANPEIKEKAQINFPVDIKYKDETTATITSAEEMQAAKESCRD